MKIIVLADAQSRGKSTSIKIACQEFLNDFASKNPVEIAKDTQTGGGDMRIAFQLSDGYRVAFCSGGDNAEIVSENYQFAINNKCDVLLTASRGSSRNDSFHKIYQLVNCTPGNEGLIVKAIDFWRDQPSVFLDTDNSHRKISELTAKHLVSTIKYAINQL